MRKLLIAAMLSGFCVSAAFAQTTPRDTRTFSDEDSAENESA